MPEDCASRIAEKAMLDSAFATNPRSATLDEVYELVTSIKKQDKEIKMENLESFILMENG